MAAPKRKLSLLLWNEDTAQVIRMVTTPDLKTLLIMLLAIIRARTNTSGPIVHITKFGEPRKTIATVTSKALSRATLPATINSLSIQPYLIDLSGERQLRIKLERQ